jgi:hypothetical protein
VSYIVKNCPTTYLNFEDKYVCTSQIKEKGFPFYCQDCTDCVIKQAIEKCKKKSGKCERCMASEDYQPTDCLYYCSYDDVVFASNILQLFDIEEINK